MDAVQIAILMGIGLIGGAWNAIAGGATLFTFPALMAAGLPPVAANATNYLALLPSNAAVLPAYRDELRGLGSKLMPLLVVSGLGAVTGSLLLLVSDPDLFVVLIPFLILLATLLFAFGDALRKRVLAIVGETRGSGLIYAALFVSSIYGGYFGAGLGIILLAIAQIMGFTDFHVGNSIKNLLATSFTILSILVFGVGGLISWPEAFTMMVGSTIGGYYGGRFAKKVNQKVLRGLVTGFGVLLSVVYFARTFG
ncbi:sulfite exporter TauE/SafE family protein [Roseibium sediminicola]|uniref:Probable membrane transporter protein n=1 Tax=Roseibium sediminicola TaxID=2933272 RepID=A0ABT0H4A7_9HYPH|nr:sulfite exporter TauE/SafE family protein [Roseibium sp. CAU 1639]MCK7615928.1 sulfite exporter TauE/SafE family protein [Roseibium sp. CAU 1639]